jgi:general secretion pathway protein H
MGRLAALAAMPILARGNCKLNSVLSVAKSDFKQYLRGFTLIELLVVMVIVGISLGVVSISALPSGHQVLQTEAKRIALLLQLARDEAILRNRAIAFEVDSVRYRFLIREENTWQLLTKDDVLREREFKHTPVTISITPPSSDQTLPLRIIFGREPVDKPFALTLDSEDGQATIQADGIGHFVAE